MLLIGLGVALVVSRSGIIDRMRPAETSLDSLSDVPLSNDPTPIMFTVRRGESAKSISQRLEQEHIIRNSFFFSTLAQLKGVENDLKAGDYELRADMRPSEILARLQQGVSRGWRVVIPEGWRTAQIADLLAQESVMDRAAFLQAAGKGSVDPAYGRPVGASVEGYLFPDTYFFPYDSRPDEIIGLMVRNFDRRLDPALRQRANERGQTIHQVLTLASIVEREAVVASERPLIASVYYNRIKAKMPLQADPTVQYAVAGGTARPGATPEAKPEGKDGYWKKELTMDDLASDSPYNTYKVVGLPPGPIANPGLASIRAVLEPADSDYLFFVAKPDGSHAFAPTFEEHLQNVQKYR